ncbi:hypothetical protein [Helicobacter bilis]|uniref:hypothetical protein n=1 Tax=Helicobacter bilis TaxID=37372 RepID=UPI000CF12362|nr:hypothetical protein [Helicobacter bilis]
MENTEALNSNQAFDLDNFVSKKYGISFIAYVKVGFTHAFLFMVLYYTLYSHTFILMCLALIQIIIVALAFISYRVQYVYFDTRGVWYYSGFLPWTKGIRGITWSDFGGAAFYQGFFAYIFHAYKISINNKYTESSRIFISNIHNGNEFVSAVNECRDILIQNGKI